MRVRWRISIIKLANSYSLSWCCCLYSKLHRFASRISPYQSPWSASKIEWRGDVFRPCEYISIYFLDNSLIWSQSSVAALFSAEGGWPYGEVRNTDPIFEKEKEIGGPNPIREVSHTTVPYHCITGVPLLILPQTNILATEQAKTQALWASTSWSPMSVSTHVTGRQKVYWLFHLC